MILYVIRHGQTHWNAQKRWQGQLDSGLTEQGRNDAAAAAALLATLKPDRLVSSDLGRCLETSASISRATGLFLSALYPEFRESNVGVIAGCTTPEAQVRFPQYFDDTGTLLSCERVTIEGSEDDAAFTARVERGVARLRREQPVERLALVTHEGVIRILDILLGVGERLITSAEVTRNGQVIRYTLA